MSERGGRPRQGLERSPTTQVAQLAIALLGFLVYVSIDHGRAASITVLFELMVFFVALAVGRTLFVPAMAAQAMWEPAVIELGCRFGATVIALALVLLREPVRFGVTLLSFAIGAAVLLTLAYRSSVRHGATWRFDPRWSVLRDTWRRTLHFAGSEMLDQFYARTDLLLIAFFLGQEHVGFYATDIKFVEVGTVPLVLFGVAVYPVLVALADGPQFGHAARDLCRVQLLLSGWLAVGMSLLIPLLIVPAFGGDFAPAIPLLPWFSVLAIVKGCEIALYRLLYSVHRQSVYFRSLAVGTVVIVILNVLLIPRNGVAGAIHATVISTACVVLINAAGLAKRVPWRVFGELLARLAAALALTWALVAAADALGAGPWVRTALGCCLFPAMAASTGLLPNLGRSSLFTRQQSLPATS